MNELCTQDFESLALLLEEGKSSSTEIALAFLERLDDVQKSVRPMAKIARERALTRARQSDERRRLGKSRSRYDGVPLTVKESLNVAGMRTTLGLPSLKDNIATENAVIVELIEAAGMVILGKSNLSQLMLFNESRNPIYGETQNPYKKGRGPGGSSGGEAAAIACDGSPGGFGTDIGGSIRVPAHYCGIFGLKPTVDRISNRGILSGIPGQEVVRGQVGPMARTTKDLRVLLDVASPKKCAALDPRVPPLPLYGQKIQRKKLKVGMFVDDGFLKPSSSLQRAVQEAAAALEKQGVTVVPYTPPLAEEITYRYVEALASDGAKTARERLGDGAVDPALELLLAMAKVPARVKNVGGKILQFAYDSGVGSLLQSIDEKSVQELWSLTARIREIEVEVIDHWRLHKLDAVLCPPHATPALLQKQSRDFVLGGALAMRYNFLNLPAGVCPITQVQKGEEYTQRQKSVLAKRAHSVDENSAGLPVGVQIVGPRYREDIVLELMQILEEAFSPVYKAQI